MDLLQELKKNPFVLAPMAGITDCAFRSFMREMGAGVVITELVSATGLKFQSQKTQKLMAFNKDQHPVGVQIFGYKLEDLDYAAKFVEEKGADFVDLNFGCPVPKVVKKGAGSAILKDLNELRKVLRTVKNAIDIPVTIKIRTGWDSQSRNSIEVAKIAYDEGISWVAIHGRTRAQSYSGESDWSYIAEVKAYAKLPILGNGDLTSAKKAVSRLVESGCDGVMIGRGCLKNPWIFRESLNLWQSSNAVAVKRDFPQVFINLKSYLEAFFEEKLVALQLKKLAAWYSAGYPGSAQFRRDIFQSQGIHEVLEKIETYFASIASHLQEDTSSEPFLMGGHG